VATAGVAGLRHHDEAASLGEQLELFVDGLAGEESWQKGG